MQLLVKNVDDVPDGQQMKEVREQYAHNREGACNERFLRVNLFLKRERQDHRGQQAQKDHRLPEFDFVQLLFQKSLLQQQQRTVFKLDRHRVCNTIHRKLTRFLRIQDQQIDSFFLDNRLVIRKRRAKTDYLFDLQVGELRMKTYPSAGDKIVRQLKERLVNPLLRKLRIDFRYPRYGLYRFGEGDPVLDMRQM